MAPMTLYYATVSTPSRAVLLAVRNLSVEVEVKQLNLMAGEHRKSEFSKINPQCCVPTLVDHEFILWESKAILIYLAEKCPRFSNSMYPKCTKTRAIIHQRLFYDSSAFYVRVLEIANLAFDQNQPKITIQHRDNLRKALTILENFLEGFDYFAELNVVTICDLAFLATMTTLVHFGFNICPYKNVNNWYKRMQEIPGFDECDKGAREFAGIVMAKIVNSFDNL